jgi:hypothetical protein
MQMAQNSHARFPGFSQQVSLIFRGLSGPAKIAGLSVNCELCYYNCAQCKKGSRIMVMSIAKEEMVARRRDLEPDVMMEIFGRHKPDRMWEYPVSDCGVSFIAELDGVFRTAFGDDFKTLEEAEDDLWGIYSGAKERPRDPDGPAGFLASRKTLPMTGEVYDFCSAAIERGDGAHMPMPFVFPDHVRVHLYAWRSYSSIHCFAIMEGPRGFEWGDDMIQGPPAKTLEEAEASLIAWHIDNVATSDERARWEAGHGSK